LCLDSCIERPLPSMSICIVARSQSAGMTQGRASLSRISRSSFSVARPLRDR
jgi:hypothetical protein